MSLTIYIACRAVIALVMLVIASILLVQITRASEQADAQRRKRYWTVLTAIGALSLIIIGVDASLADASYRDSAPAWQLALGATGWRFAGTVAPWAILVPALWRYSHNQQNDSDLKQEVLALGESYTQLVERLRDRDWIERSRREIARRLGEAAAAERPLWTRAESHLLAWIRTAPAICRLGLAQTIEGDGDFNGGWRERREWQRQWRTAKELAETLQRHLKTGERLTEALAGPRILDLLELHPTSHQDSAWKRARQAQAQGDSRALAAALLDPVEDWPERWQSRWETEAYTMAINALHANASSHAREAAAELSNPLLRAEIAAHLMWQDDSQQAWIQPQLAAGFGGLIAARRTAVWRASHNDENGARHCVRGDALAEGWFRPQAHAPETTTTSAI